MFLPCFPYSFMYQGLLINLHGLAYNAFTETRAELAGTAAQGRGLEAPVRLHRGSLQR